MDTDSQTHLIEELLGLKAASAQFLDDSITRAPVAHYSNSTHFEAERTRIFQRYPQMVAHCSDLDAAGAFLRIDVAGRPVLLTRDREMTVHAFLNVCRHRGARLVEAETGCKHVFSCPYHGWTYTNQGDLRGIPHQKTGFPNIDKPAHGLIRLPVQEQDGWIWVCPDPDSTIDIADTLAPIAADVSWLGGATLHTAQQDVIDIAANWKILIEGGIEAYHFKVAHAATIGPYFEDNLSSYQVFGTHMRSILPRATIADLQHMPRETWDIRAHANVLYTFFPLSQILVQKDHLVWIRSEPLAADHTRLHLRTMAPKAANETDGHWARNHAITRRTLMEDFDIGAGIQAGLASRANSHLTFGRYEGALGAFGRLVDAALT